MTAADLTPAPGSANEAAARKAFAAGGIARLEAPFTPAAAQALHCHLAEELAWSRAVNQGDKSWDLGPESIAQLERDGDGPLMHAVHKGARDGFQYLFDSVRVSDDAGERRARGWLVDRLVEALNSPAALALLREVTGLPVSKVDGQATRYLPGHFLTGHDDGVAGKDRLAAYVISLNPRWRTEWGGLLLFHDARGDVTSGLVPCFNAMHLFSVPRLHSVSQVAPFAPVPRYSVTGWLRG
jgi:hypothetical protein